MRQAASVVLACLLAVALATTHVETKDVQPVQRLEQVISGHLTDLNGKYKFRVSEVTYQSGGYVGDHHHAGPGVQVVMAGEFTYVKGDKTTVYKPGDLVLRAGRCDASCLQSRKYDSEGDEYRNPNCGLQWICAYPAAAVT
jgi:hypothetical protein